MLHVICPNNNVVERFYAIQVLFSDILGLGLNDYSIEFQDNTSFYSLSLNDRRIVIEDHFFNRYPEPLSYLHIENIPENFAFFHGFDIELPIIYGIDKFEHKGNTYVIGLDVFASTFFMLTRWEESVLGREEVGDCDENRLFAVKYGFSNRPIVNEYAFFLKRLLFDDYGLKMRNYEVVLSHDVDGFITPSWNRIIKDFIRQIIHGAPKNTVLNLTWKEEIKYKRALPSSSCQFNMYLGLAEKYSIQEWFYFKVCGKGEKEATYLFDDKQTINIVKWVGGHHNQKRILGFHPSQNVFGNEHQWNEEVSRIIRLLDGRPCIGRNHHLLYNFEILRLWEQITDKPLNISNCVFHKRHGFRSGSCSPYRLFDIYQRRIMNLVEHPCQIMDTVIRYDDKFKSVDERWTEIKGIIDWVKKCRGELVLTWHIYIRNRSIITDYFKWCERIVQYAVNG